MHMEHKESGEFLCISENGKNYAVEFPYITEICYNVSISRFPCLPEHFLGVYNYKGTMLPVISLEREGQKDVENTDSKSIIVVISCGKYQMGILLYEEPRIIAADMERIIECPSEEVHNTGIWKEKWIYKEEEGIISVVDMEKTMENLVIFR